MVVLRAMSTRFRRSGGFVDHDVAYGPAADESEATPETVP
jgi:hypothetical protein